jgi:hypothetical protein
MSYMAALMLVAIAFGVFLGILVMIAFLIAIIWKTYMAVKLRDSQVALNVVAAAACGLLAALVTAPLFKGDMGREFAINIDNAYQYNGDGKYVAMQFIVGLGAYFGPWLLAWVYLKQRVLADRTYIEYAPPVLLGLLSAVITSSWVIMLSTQEWSRDLGI